MPPLAHPHRISEAGRGCLAVSAVAAVWVVCMLSKPLYPRCTLTLGSRFTKRDSSGRARPPTRTKAREHRLCRDAAGCGTCNSCCSHMHHAPCNRMPIRLQLAAWLADGFDCCQQCSAAHTDNDDQCGGKLWVRSPYVDLQIHLCWVGHAF